MTAARHAQCCEEAIRSIIYHTLYRRNRVPLLRAAAPLRSAPGGGSHSCCSLKACVDVFGVLPDLRRACARKLYVIFSIGDSGGDIGLEVVSQVSGGLDV